MTFFYNLAYVLFAIAYFPIFVIKSRQAENRADLISQRLGLFSGAFKERLLGKRVLWLHAVSVGEVMAVENFIKELLVYCPGCHIVLTTVTPTGQAIAAKINSERLIVAYFPFDISLCVNSFFKTLNPECLLLTETEIWPNVLSAAKKRHVPVGILNGRLSPRSSSRYAKFDFIFESLFQKLDFVLAQTDEDAERFRAVGVPADRIRVLGNMKYDSLDLKQENSVRVDELKKIWNLEEGRVVVIGSTHPGEEEILGDVIVGLKEKHPEWKYVLAPRHIERTPEIIELLRKKGLTVRDSNSVPDSSGSNFDVLILNELGVLKHMYSLAAAVYMGGSLIKKGGQNPVEAITYKKAVIHGPYIFNFEKTYKILDEEGGALLVQNQGELFFALDRLMSSPSEQKKLGENAFQLMASLRGATKRHVEWLKNFLTSESQLVKG